MMVLRETARSIRRRFWINALLAVQFTICFFLLITMLTYYLQIGDSHQFNTIRQVNGRDWHMMRMELDAGMTQFSELALAPDGLGRVNGLYGELCSSKAFDMISFREGQCVYLSSTLMDERFGAGGYEELIDDCSGTIAHSLCYQELKDGEQTFPGIALKSVQMNRQAWSEFGLQTQEGEGLNEINTTVDAADMAVPIVLGNDYSGAFAVGERVRMNLPTVGCEESYFEAEVVGILKKGSIMPAYGGELSGTVELDQQIICGTGLELAAFPESQQEKGKFASAIYADALMHSCISPTEGTAYQMAVKAANDISEGYDIRLFFTSVSFGMELLLQESQTAMTILLILTAAMAAFTVFCLASACISRVRDNAGVYAIRMLNGAGIMDIILPCLLEFALLLIPALAVNYAVMRPKMAENSNYVPILAVAVMAAGVFLLAGAIIAWKIGGINIEELMRRED